MREAYSLRVDQKKELLDIAKRFGVSGSTIKAWVARVKREPKPGLVTVVLTPRGKDWPTHVAYLIQETATDWIVNSSVLGAPVLFPKTCWKVSP
jgi:hypothetical protein